MAKLVQRRRGTTAEHSAFTGAVGEITHNTTKHTLVIHDGTTAGGHELARKDLSNVSLVNLIGITELKTSDGSDGQVLTTDGSGNVTFRTVDVASAAVGGDLTGTVSNAQIGSNKVGITELNVTDGTNGQVLTTNGSGTLSFASTGAITVGGDLSGTTSNAQIVASAVTSTELATNAVTTTKLTDANVTAAKLASDSVTTIKILNSNITTAKIADNAITDSKMADDAVGVAELSATGTASSSTFLRGDNAWSTDGSGLLNLPYDVAFNAGYDADMVKEDITVATYGELVMARAGTFLGENGFIDTPATGATAIVDILKNGTTIYSTKPTFAIASNTATAGVLSVTSFAAGDRITFKITQKGSTEAGEGLRFTLRCKA